MSCSGTGVTIIFTCGLSYVSLMILIAQLLKFCSLYNLRNFLICLLLAWEVHMCALMKNRAWILKSLSLHLKGVLSSLSLNGFSKICYNRARRIIILANMHIWESYFVRLNMEALFMKYNIIGECSFWINSNLLWKNMHETPRLKSRELTGFVKENTVNGLFFILWYYLVIFRSAMYKVQNFGCNTWSL